MNSIDLQMLQAHDELECSEFMHDMHAQWIAAARMPGKSALTQLLYEDMRKHQGTVVNVAAAAPVKPLDFSALEKLVKDLGKVTKPQKPWLDDLIDVNTSIHIGGSPSGRIGGLNVFNYPITMRGNKPYTVFMDSVSLDAPEDPDKDFWKLMEKAKRRSLFTGVCTEKQGHHKRKLQPNRGPVGRKDWK